MLSKVVDAQVNKFDLIRGHNLSGKKSQNDGVDCPAYNSCLTAHTDTSPAEAGQSDLGLKN